MNVTCASCRHETQLENSLAGAVIHCPHCHEPVKVPELIAAGMRMGDFLLEKRLGCGGMGEVWLARQDVLDRKVAVKILSPDLTSNTEFVARFKKEIVNLAKLNHPNIITAFHGGCQNGLYYMAVSYVDGIELADKMINEGVFQEKEALKITRQVADALRYAWDEFKMLHRDIKPTNIMLEKNGSAKLMDLGISKIKTEESGLTVTGVVLGTPHFMSPEQAIGDKDVDFRADLYSLGATLYLMVTGTFVFDSNTAMGVLSKQIKEAFPSPKTRNPNLSDQCEALLSIMLAKDRNSRQKSWEDVIRDIDLVLAGKFPKTPLPPANQKFNWKKIRESGDLAHDGTEKKPEKERPAPSPRNRNIHMMLYLLGVAVLAILFILSIVFSRSLLAPKISVEDLIQSSQESDFELIPPEKK